MKGLFQVALHRSGEYVVVVKRCKLERAPDGRHYKRMGQSRQENRGKERRRGLISEIGSISEIEPICI
jgi:hypothetical protein